MNDEKDFDLNDMQDVEKILNALLGGLSGTPFGSNDDADSSTYERVLKEAVGSNSKSIFAQRDMMKAAREGDEYLQNDALSTGMSLCAIADAMFIKENYNDSLIRYVRAAIRYDIPMAQWRIGMCLYHGFYVEKDTEEAKRWFAEAAKHEYKNAIDSLNNYDSGNDVSETTEEAKEKFIALISVEG